MQKSGNNKEQKSLDHQSNYLFPIASNSLRCSSNYSSGKKLTQQINSFEALLAEKKRKRMRNLNFFIIFSIVFIIFQRIAWRWELREGRWEIGSIKKKKKNL